MDKQLTSEQKRKIDSLLSSNKRSPGNRTIGDDVKKLLNLSDREFTELANAIEEHVVNFFEDRFGSR